MGCDKLYNTFLNSTSMMVWETKLTRTQLLQNLDWQGLTKEVNYTTKLVFILLTFPTDIISLMELKLI